MIAWASSKFIFFRLAIIVATVPVGAKEIIDFGLCGLPNLETKLGDVRFGLGKLVVMGAPDTSLVPKKDPMGMDCIRPNVLSISRKHARRSRG